MVDQLRLFVRIDKVFSREYSCLSTVHQTGVIENLQKMHQSKMLRRIRAEEKLETRREDLLKVVNRFYGEPFASQIAAAIASLNDQARLDQLFDGVVLQGMSQEAFRAALAATA